jgi:2-keto-4-pentenoate hydratase/2-oxohepta-3-ene-1,7-dioic acid hydratase in catechol pathway
MKLLTFMKKDDLHLGIQTEQGIVDVAAAQLEIQDKKIPTDIMDVVQGGSAPITALENLLQKLDFKNKAYMIDEKDVEWGPCIPEPRKIICVGLNYRRHADETNAPYPEVPILFNKFHNTITAHKKEIAVPKVTDKLDYEVELGIVIGKTAKYVSKEKALNYVFGYCTVNDLSARDLQLRTQQWLLGKSCDDFSPVGPYLVTAEEVGNPQNLTLKTLVNGEVRQNSNTSDMIFTCAEIVSYISQHMTLVPGDLILTGTPEGVVLGLPADQQVYLKPGDVVTVEIEKLGSLTNRFVEEK